MKANTLLLAHLAKSAKGNAQQQEGDTRISVPNTFLPTLRIPLPFYSFISNPVLSAQQNSFIYTDSRLMNANVNTFLCTLSAGLWEVAYNHYLSPAGAVEDLTAAARLTIVLVDGTNPQADLSYLANSKVVNQNNSGKFTVLVSAEQQIQFGMITNVGAGTGTNFSKLVLFCSKFF